MVYIFQSLGSRGHVDVRDDIGQIINIKTMTNDKYTLSKEIMTKKVYFLNKN